MALKELSAVLRCEAGNLPVPGAPQPSFELAGNNGAEVTQVPARSERSLEQHLEQLAAEVKLLRTGLTSVVEAVDVVQPALQKEVELRGLRDQQVENLELQIKDLRSDLCEIMTLKVKPRLASLEREASETRRRLLPLPTCSVAGEHTGSCRHCRSNRGSATFRAASPDGEELKKAKKELQDIGEALLDRARRELQRQEELVQARCAVEQRQQLILDAAGRDMSNEARDILRLAEQSAQQLAEQRAKEVTQSVATELLKKAETVLQSEIAEVNAVSCEATDALRERLTEAQTAAEQFAASGMQKLKRDSEEGAVTLRDGFSKVEKTLRSEVARISTAANSASQEATCASQQISRLQAGVRGVEETLERRTQWMRTAKSELEVSISEAAAASMGAVSRSVRSISSEVEEQQRGRIEDAARLERFEDATQRQAQAQAKVLDELREAVLATAERRPGEEQNLMKKVHDVLRALKEKLSKEGRETVEAAGRAVAEARLELQQELLQHAETVAKSRAVATAREEVSREVATLRRDVEEQVREDLRKQMMSLGQECSASIEAQVKDSLANSNGRLERRMEELFRDYRAQERSEVRVIAAKTESLCEEQVRQLLWQVEDQTKLAASKTEEGWHLAQTLQERAAAAVNFAEAEAQRLAARGEAKAEEHCQHAEAEALRLAQRGEERAAVAAKLAQAKAEELASRAEEQVVHITEVAEAMASRTKEEAAASAKYAEEHAASLAARVEDSGAQCKELMGDLSRSHLQKVETMQDVVKGTLQKMEALEAEYRASLELFNAMKDQAFAAAQQAFEAQEESATTKRYVEESRVASEKALMEVRSELSAFIDEQRVFCGFIDTEQRSYQELIRQEVNALSRLVDATLRIDPPMSNIGASPASTLEGLQPLEPMGELPIAFADQVLRSSG